MSREPAEGQPTTANLGGGFVHLRRADGTAAIIATAMADSGAVGIMSGADVNARSDEDLRRWLGGWAFPDHVRLRPVDQVHGARVVDAASYDVAAPDADGVWTRSPADVLVIRAADCAPVWFSAPSIKAVAMAHAGWRGIAAGVIENAVAALGEAGASASDLHVAVGPHIGPCCFEVGSDVARAFEHDPGAVLGPERLIVDRRRPDSVSVDLSAAMAHRLGVAGVSPSRTSIAQACTRCRSDILHSYRRNGQGGPLMAAVGAVLP